LLEYLASGCLKDLEEYRSPSVEYQPMCELLLKCFRRRLKAGWIQNVKCNSFDLTFFGLAVHQQLLDMGKHKEGEANATAV
jgi:hypothetical protein